MLADTRLPRPDKSFAGVDERNRCYTLFPRELSALVDTGDTHKQPANRVPILSWSLLGRVMRRYQRGLFPRPHGKHRREHVR